MCDIGLWFICDEVGHSVQFICDKVCNSVHLIYGQVSSAVSSKLHCNYSVFLHTSDAFLSMM